LLKQNLIPRLFDSINQYTFGPFESETSFRDIKLDNLKVSFPDPIDSWEFQKQFNFTVKPGSDINHPVLQLKADKLDLLINGTFYA